MCCKQLGKRFIGVEMTYNNNILRGNSHECV